MSAWQIVGLVVGILAALVGAVLTFAAIADKSEGWDRQAQALAAAFFAVVTTLGVVLTIWAATR